MFLGWGLKFFCMNSVGSEIFHSLFLGSETFEEKINNASTLVPAINNDSSLTTLQLFLIILNCVGIYDRSQHAQNVNAVLFNMKLITLPLWSIYKVVCYFHANSNHWLNLLETI